MSEISLARLKVARLERKPFDWACIEETFESPDEGLRLMQQFPDRDFSHLESNVVGKQYSMRGLSATSEMNGLTHAWRQFLRSLEKSRYRRTLGALTGIELGNLRQEITLWRYSRGDFLGPHTDKEDKIVTHIVYFSDPDWTSEDGGCLDILATADSNSVIRRIAPVCGRSVVLVRSDQSWHAVTPQVRSVGDRLAVQVVFHRPGLSYSRELRSGNADPSMEA